LETEVTILSSHILHSVHSKDQHIDRRRPSLVIIAIGFLIAHHFFSFFSQKRKRTDPSHNTNHFKSTTKDNNNEYHLPT
jgi:hypothetical protein